MTNAFTSATDVNMIVTHVDVAFSPLVSSVVYDDLFHPFRL